MKLWVIILFALLTLKIESLFATSAVAKIQFMKNDVKILRHPGRRVVLAKKGQPLFKGDRVLTGKSSVVKILFLNSDSLVLGPEGKIQIDSFGHEPVKLINLLRGQIRSQVNKNKDDHLKMLIKTKSAALGVRGTDFQIQWNPEEKLFQSYVKKGHVVLSEVYEGQDYEDIKVVLMSPEAKDLQGGEYLGFYKGLWSRTPIVVTQKKRKPYYELEEDPAHRLAREAMENARENANELNENARDITNIYRRRLGR